MSSTILSNLSTEQQAFIASVAHLVWWQDAGQAKRNPDYLVRQVMRYGTLEQCVAVERLFAKEQLKDVLLAAEPGQLNRRSWNFWYARLFDCSSYAEIAPMPVRGTGAKIWKWA